MKKIKKISSYIVVIIIIVFISFNISLKYYHYYIDIQLLKSIKNNNISEVEKYINKGANVNFEYWGDNIFDKYSKKLLVKIADVDLKLGESGSPLITAINEKNETIVNLLISKGANVNRIDKHGGTLLHFAVCTHNINIVDSLLSKGADLSIKNFRSEEPLYYAAGIGDKKMVEFLINRNNKINKNEALLNSITEESYQGQSEVAKFLIEKGANVNTQSRFGETPIMRAVENRNKKMVEFLLSKGARIDLKGTGNYTVLHYAARNDDYEIIKLIISKVPISSIINIKNDEGLTALGIARQRSDTKLINLLQPYSEKAENKKSVK